MTEQRLEKILESLELEDRRLGRVSAKDIPVKRKGLYAYIGVSEPDKLHFLVGPVEVSEPDQVEDIKLKNLQCKVVRWSVGGAPEAEFIDISCQSPINGGFRKPFLAFAENVLDSINEGQNQPELAVRKVFKKWRRFWSLSEMDAPSLEWMKGLLGELIFLKSLLGRFGNLIIETWKGPAGGIHDFCASGVAFEVKTTQSNPCTIVVNGLSQLDPLNWDFLFLVLYRLERNNEGLCLSDVVREIELKLDTDETGLDEFWKCLVAAGYRRDQEQIYSRTHFSISNAEFFEIDKRFPKLTKSSFAQPLDSRISSLRYSVELSGLEAVPDDSPIVKQALAKFGSAED